MPRLPQPGSDNGTWGNILNEYLSQAHDSDGTLKDNAVTSNILAPNSVTNAALATDAVNAASVADGSIADAHINAGAAIAQTKIFGLTGDLAAKAVDANVVHVTGAETIAGVKTFSFSPIVPTPTTSSQVTSKSYIDDKLVESSYFSGVTASLRHNRSATIQNMGDSTGDATDEWLGLMGITLGTYFDANILWVKWNDVNQSYDAPSILRASTNGERATTLSSASLQYAGTAVTGDIEIIAKVNPTSWSAAQTILSRYETVGNQRGFQFNLSPSGRIQFIWSTDGTSGTATTIQSTISVPFSNSTAGWVRMTFDVDNGASGNTATFYTSTDGSSWSGLGTAVTTASATSIHASTTPYQVGSYGAGIATPFAGQVMWVQLRNAVANGTDQIPPILDDWGQVSSSLGNTVQATGGPNLLLLCGSQSGQGLTYLDNGTRRPKLIAPYGQDVIILSTGHNDSGSGLEYIATYATWVSNIKSGRPNVPIIILTQNSTKIGSVITNINIQQIRAARQASLATWAASQSGLTILDTHAAFTDPATQISSDGLHPTLAGEQAWANWLLRKLAPQVL